MAEIDYVAMLQSEAENPWTGLDADHLPLIQIGTDCSRQGNLY